MCRKVVFGLFILLTIALLSACGMRTAEDMYALPKRSSQYEKLQSQMDRAMADLTFEAPLSGENRQAVQLADLDGDGKEEYIVFAKGAIQEKPLQILVFRENQDNSFTLIDQIESSGTSYECVEYVDINGKPGLEMIVGKLLNSQVMRIASVYTFQSGQSEQMLSTIYAKYITCDFDSDNRSELMVIRHGENEDNKAVAVLYNFEKDAMERSKEASLSESAEQIKRISISKLLSGEPAVYVASAVEREDAIVTDIFTLKNRLFTNISYSTEYGTSVQTLRNYYVYSEDIDNDGVPELPSLITTRQVNDDSRDNEYFAIRWYSLDIDGNEHDKMFTFHNYNDGWYLRLVNEWVNRIALDRNGSTYTFYLWNESFDDAKSVFSIYSLREKDRDFMASTENRFALYRAERVVYAAKLEPGSALNQITEEYLVHNFYLIRKNRINNDDI